MSQLMLGLIAVVAGVVVGLLVFVPVVAIAYRRRGGLSFGEVVLWSAALLYGIAIWVYTLLPLPEPDAIVCTTPQLDPLAFVGDLRSALASGNPLTDIGFLQLALNVLLFVPLGFFLRVIWRRGVLVALVVGAVLSLLIETTQVTGVWGLYPCAYRLFDVDDLLTNTLGAVLGSVLALMVPAKYRARGAAREKAMHPRPVTRSRRLVAALCDWLSVTLTGFATLIAIVMGAALTVGDHVLDPAATQWVPWTVVLVPVALTGGFFIATGRTIGQAAVQLRYTGSPYPRAIAGLLVFGGGIGGYQLIQSLPTVLSGWATPMFVLASVVMIFTTAGGRGLPGLLSRSVLVDSRADETAGQGEAVLSDPSRDAGRR